MRVLGRVLAVCATFFLVGYATMHALITKNVAKGVPEYSVRLGGAMAGLFAGGAVASLVGIGFLFGGKRSDPDDQV